MLKSMTAGNTQQHNKSILHLQRVRNIVFVLVSLTEANMVVAKYQSAQVPASYSNLVHTMAYSIV